MNGNGASWCASAAVYEGGVVEGNDDGGVCVKVVEGVGAGEGSGVCYFMEIGWMLVRTELSWHEYIAIQVLSSYLCVELIVFGTS